MSDLTGFEDIVGWFGKWPSFHDAEVLSIHIERERRSHAGAHLEHLR